MCIGQYREEDKAFTGVALISGERLFFYWVTGYQPTFEEDSVRSRMLETDRFTVVSDDGQKFTIIVLTGGAEVTSNQYGEAGELLGLKHYRTIDGQAVDKNSNGTFKLTASGLNLRRGGGDWGG